MRLLLIEDEEDLAKPLIKALSNYGFAVDYSNEGKSGLLKAEINHYDCILLDLNLPGIDGISISNKLRAQNINTPILMVTAKHQLDDKLIGFEAGADDYISKPFNLEELTARIKAVVRRSSENKSQKLEFLDFELLPDKNILRNTLSGDCLLYTSFLLTPIIGIALSKFNKKPDSANTALVGLGGSLLSILIFFLWTNFGVVVTTSMYRCV